jgi:hypothetical protein
MCWYCRWGWPKAVADIYLRAERDIDAMIPEPGPENDWTDWDGEPSCGESALKYGPTHCVWEDENFGGDFEFELKECDSPMYANWLPGAMDVVRRSVRELLALPESVRMPRQDYFEEHPDGRTADDFPPPPEIEMVTGP